MATIRTVLVLLVVVTAGRVWAADAASKPRVAVFPLLGTAADDLRQKVGYAIRAKLDRDGTYEVIDGVTMTEIAAQGVAPALAAKPADLAKSAEAEKPSVLVWGELSGGTTTDLAGATLRVKVLDLRRPDAKPVEVSKTLAMSNDLRSAAEAVVAALPGTSPAKRPNETEVVDDAESKALWAKNPNLVTNGAFADAGGWQALYEGEKYRVRSAKELPEKDKVAIVVPPAAKAASDTSGKPAAPPDPVLAMVLSTTAAENAGLACLSEPIAIRPGRRYRVSFRYKSDGPNTHVFIKGYTDGKDLAGKPAERECFRTQVSPTWATGNEWRTVVADINPFHPSFPVRSLRVDLYAYGRPGTILWDDVVVKEVGPLTKKPQDDAIEKPVD